MWKEMLAVPLFFVMLLAAGPTAADPGHARIAPEKELVEAQEPTTLSQGSQLSSLPRCYDYEFPNDYVSQFDFGTGFEYESYGLSGLQQNGVVIGSIPVHSPGSHYAVRKAALYFNKTIHLLEESTNSSRIAPRATTAMGSSENYIVWSVAYPSGSYYVSSSDLPIHLALPDESRLPWSGRFDAIGEDGTIHGVFRRFPQGPRDEQTVLLTARVANNSSIVEMVTTPGAITKNLYWGPANRKGQRTANLGAFSSAEDRRMLADSTGLVRALGSHVHYVTSPNERGEFVTTEHDSAGGKRNLIRNWSGAIISELKPTSEIYDFLIKDRNDNGVSIGYFSDYRSSVGYSSLIVKDGGTPKIFEDFLCASLPEGRNEFLVLEKINNRNEIIGKVLNLNDNDEIDSFEVVVLRPRYDRQALAF